MRPTFTPAPSLTLGDYLVREISRKILLGELQPGERLQEAAIAQQVQVSRGTVREALRVLQEQGLVTYSPNRGVRVMELSIEDVRKGIDVRALLEGYAARLAAPHIDGQGIDLLSTIVDRMQITAEHDNPNKLIELDVEFHRVIAEIAGNQLLSRHIALLSVQVRPHFAAGHLLGQDPYLIPRVHRELLAVLSERDPNRSERAVRDHIYTFGQLFIERLQIKRHETEESSA